MSKIGAETRSKIRKNLGRQRAYERQISLPGSRRSLRPLFRPHTISAEAARPALRPLRLDTVFCASHAPLISTNYKCCLHFFFAHMTLTLPLCARARGFTSRPDKFYLCPIEDRRTELQSRARRSQIPPLFLHSQKIPQQQQLWPTRTVSLTVLSGRVFENR